MNIKNLIKSTVLSATVFLSFNALAVDMNAASWYLNVDVNSIKQGPLKSILDHKDEDFNKVVNIFMGKEFHDQINQVTLYGDTEGFEDFSILIQGDFSENAKHQFFNHSNIKLDESVEVYNNSRIRKWSINSNTKIIGMEEEAKFDEDSNLELYLTEITPNLIMVSRDLSDTKNWLSNKYDINDINQNGLFSVIVNLQEALAHGGMKIEDGNMDFHSQVLKKVSQLSFSVIEDGANYILEAALTSEDDATAVQVEQVINGLIALNGLSNVSDNPLHEQLMGNLNIDRDGLNIIISSSVSSDLIVEKIAENHSH